MIPSLPGRMQTRLFSVLVIGTIWTLLVTPLLPRPTEDFIFFTEPVPLSTMYAAMFLAVALAAGIGCLWEVAYHGVSLLRWDRDFPSLWFGVASIWEFVPVALIVHAVYGPPLITMVIHFFGLWLLVWLFVQGPIRVIFPRWRFSGGRLR